MRSVIFDLDLTLVDSTIAEQGRKDRQWDYVYTLIPQFTLYEGMLPVFEIIRKNSIKTAIVSTSPRPYLERVIQHFNIPCSVIVGYHDAKPIKPHPASILKALELLQVDAKNAISFGDRVIDIQASNAAGVESVACFWGTKEKKELLSSGYRHAIVHPSEILTMIR